MMRNDRVLAGLTGVVLVGGILWFALWHRPASVTSVPNGDGDQDPIATTNHGVKEGAAPSIKRERPPQGTDPGDFANKRLSLPPAQRDSLKSLLVESADPSAESRLPEKVQSAARQMARLKPDDENLELFVLALGHPAADIRTATIDNLVRHRSYKTQYQIARSTAGRRSAHLQSALTELQLRLGNPPPD